MAERLRPQASPRPRRGPGAARAARGSARARSVHDRRRPRPGRARFRARRPPRDHLDRGRARDRAAGRGRAGRRRDRARNRLAGRRSRRGWRRGSGFRTRSSRPPRACAVSKARQRERFEAAGVPQPRWRLVVRGRRTDLRLPCVVKAPDRQGQRGLSVVRDAGASCGRRSSGRSRRRAAAAPSSRSSSTGPEVTVNAFSVDGGFYPLTVTDRLDRRAAGVRRRARARLAVARPTRDAAAEAAPAGGRRARDPGRPDLHAGADRPDGPQVIEVAARLGGGHDAELCQAALGVDLNGLALAAALGEETSAPGPAAAGRRRACTAFLVPPPGELAAPSRASRTRSARRASSRVRVYRRPGFRVRRAPRRRRPRRSGARGRRKPGRGATSGRGRRPLSYASRPMPLSSETRRATMLASSRPPSARRRSTPSPRRSARAG